MKRIRILVVDDSASARAALRIALADEPSFEVVGEAADGQEAHRLIDQLTPDLITMDVFLRAESGLDLTAAVMAARATPVVVVTAADVRDPTLVFRAMQAGALDVCAKLPGPMHPDYARRRAHLVRMLKALAQVPVVHRAVAAARGAQAKPELSRLRALGPRTSEARTAGGRLLLGASTGGPPLLAKVLRALPKPFPQPILIVQHIVSSFVPGLAKWLEESSGHPVSLVTDACPLASGVIYLPAADHHLLIDGVHVRACQTDPRGSYRPSVDVLFESAASSPAASQSIAALLTGMGADGARGLVALRQAGALTIAQEPQSCTVPSMPARAIALGAAVRILGPDALAPAIIEALGKRTDCRVG